MTIQKVVLIHPRAKFSSLEMHFTHLSFERRAQGLFVLGDKYLQQLIPILADWMLPMHLHMASLELAAVMLCSRNAGIPTCIGIHKLLISAKGIASLRSDPLGPSNCTEQSECWFSSAGQHLCNSLRNTSCNSHMWHRSN